MRTIRGESVATHIKGIENQNPIQIYKYINIQIYTFNLRSQREPSTSRLLNRGINLNYLNNGFFGNVNPAGRGKR